jgi:hypothetical protein
LSDDTKFDQMRTRVGGIRDWETLADETDKANGTYSYYVDTRSFRKVGIQLVLTGTISVTLHGSVQADVAMASRDYDDVTSAMTGSASITTSSIIADDQEFCGCLTSLRIDVTCAGGGTDDYKIFAKRLY